MGGKWQNPGVHLEAVRLPYAAVLFTAGLSREQSIKYQPSPVPRPSSARVCPWLRLHFTKLSVSRACLMCGVFIRETNYMNDLGSLPLVPIVTSMLITAALMTQIVNIALSSVNDTPGSL